MNIVILAAGMGKRMKSDLPKVLHPIAGKPLLGHVLDTARALMNNVRIRQTDDTTRSANAGGQLVGIFGHGGDIVPTRMAGKDIIWAKQEPQLGTGHAVMQAVPFLDDSVPTLILYGDVPLTRVETLTELLNAAGSEKMAILTVILPDPAGYGRIVRKNGQIHAIIEHKDADEATRKINEINSGILVAPTPSLKRWLSGLSNNNAQKEYYLTDIVAAAVRDGVPVLGTHPAHGWETDGVNSKVQLAELMPTLENLPRHDKLEVVRYLMSDLTRREGVDLLQNGASYPVWTPFDAFDAAKSLQQMLDQDLASR